MLEISCSDDDMLLTGFSFDVVQTVEIKDFRRDLIAMSFDNYNSTTVLDIMRGMLFLLDMGLGRC